MIILICMSLCLRPIAFAESARDWVSKWEALGYHQYRTIGNPEIMMKWLDLRRIGGSGI